MKKESFYTIVIVFLLLINMGTLGYLWMGAPKPGHMPPPHPPRGEAGRVLIDELQLDEQQQADFNQFKRKHRRSTDSVQRLIRQTQVALFGLVKQDEMNVPVRDSLLHAIEQYESAKHMITIDHFHDIRSILKPEQKILFNEMVEDIGSRITGPGEGRPGHPPRR